VGYFESRTIHVANNVHETDRRARPRAHELHRGADGAVPANQSTFSDRLEVSDKDLVLLRALASGGPMIIRALGGRFGVRVSTMTCLVHRMEKKGLVHRVRHREDRRALELEATPTGALVLREHGRAMEAIARGMLEALSERDQDALSRSSAGSIERSRARAARPRPAETFVAK
jgi:DNA-binding MarR family transcriptional regulator